MSAERDWIDIGFRCVIAYFAIHMVVTILFGIWLLAR